MRFFSRRSDFDSLERTCPGRLGKIEPPTRSSRHLPAHHDRQASLILIGTTRTMAPQQAGQHGDRRGKQRAMRGGRIGVFA